GTPCMNSPGAHGKDQAGGNVQVQVQPANPCCNITGIDASGRVTARETASGRTFEFQVKDAAMLNSLHLGQSIAANFGTSQVTIYGATPCCQISSQAGASRAMQS